MSEHQTQSIASIIKPPTGEVVISDADITISQRQKNIGFIAVGSADIFQCEITPDAQGIAYVEMNKSGKMGLEQGEDGVIATSSLAGCTGVAGFARRKDGSIATFVSHYDSMSQDGRLTGRDSPVNRDLYGFRYQSQREGVGLDSPLLYVVAYEQGEHQDPDYGKKVGAFKDWRYLDQINTTATQLGDNAQVLLLPYQISRGHTLASGRMDGVEGIFWNGVKVDFDSYLAPKETPASV
ncbi:hypothetical protein KC952_03970 [Candidatus Saccharibacteria bacterium]|nr:hypothetical protein [Candidatus Saccharibacteria bacterium]